MSVKEIFETMDYGPAPEAAGDALAWIVDQGSRFGPFIDGAFRELEARSAETMRRIA